MQRRDEETTLVSGLNKGEHWFVMLASFAILLIFSFSGLREFHLFYDEGYVITATQNIMAGRLPYRDFDLIYTPLTFYLNAALMNLFRSIIIPRLLNLLYALAGVYGIYILSSKLIPNRARLIPPIMYAIYIIPVFNVPMPSVLANTLLIFAAISFLGKKEWLSGILLSLCFLAKQNVGIFGAVAFGAFILISHKPKAWPRKLIQLAAPAIAVLLLYIMYLVVTHSLSGFIDFVFLYPLIYKDAISAVSILGPFINFTLSFEAISRCLLRILYLVPIPLYLITFISALSSNIKERKTLLLITLLCALNYLQFFPNKDIAHFAWGFAPSFILLGYWLGQKKFSISAIVTVLTIGYLLIAIYGVHFYGTSPFIKTEKAKVPGMGFLALTPSSAGLAEEIHNRFENSSIYVFSGDYSLFYFISGNLIPSRVLQHSGGQYATPKRQMEIIDELAKSKPNYIISRKGPIPEGYGLLWQYIQSTYTISDSIKSDESEFEIYQRAVSPAQGTKIMQ